MSESQAQISSPKPIDRWLAIAGIVVGTVFFLMPKTPPVVIGCLLLIFIIALHPLVNFWWVERTGKRKVFAVLLWAIICVGIGYTAWPPPPSKPLTAKDVVDEMDRRNARTSSKEVSSAKDVHLPSESVTRPGRPQNEPKAQEVSKAKSKSSDGVSTDKPKADGSRPQVVINAPGGIGISGGTVTNPTVNNYVTPGPPPEIEWSVVKTIEPGEYRGPRRLDPRINFPGQQIRAVLKGPFPNPSFRVECESPCSIFDMIPESVGTYAFSSTYDTSRKQPNVDIQGFPGISILEANVSVLITISSANRDPVKVTSVKSHLRR